MKILATLIIAATLAGCASFSPDGGIGKVNALTQSRVKQPATWLRGTAAEAEAAAATRALLSQPLTADDAVKLALLNNRSLQAAYADLGIAEADLVQAGRLRNPGFSFARLTRADQIEIDRTFLVDVLGLITLPLRTELEQRRVAQTQLRVAGEVLQVAADTRRAWISAVAAQEAEAYAIQVQQAAEAGAELARRMAAAGNFSKLDHAREQVFYADATAQLARARQSVVTERERLTRLMGLWGDNAQYRLPERLPALPKAARELRNLEQQAMTERLDVRAATRAADDIAASLGLTRAIGFINVLEAGYQRNSASGEPRQTGYEIELRLPLFDWGGARVARAEHTYRQALDRAAYTAMRARSEVREAYAAYRTAFDLSQHYRNEIVPLRKHMSEELLLRYNGMLVSVFELLADARQQIAAVSAAIDAQRDFWLAETNLDLALSGTSPGSLRLSALPAASGAAQPAH